SRAAECGSVVPPPTAPLPPDAPGAADGPALVPGDGAAVVGAPDCRPSEVIEAGEPGAMLLSFGSNRSTANRTGALGSAGGADGTAVGVAPGAGVAGAPELPGVAVAIGVSDWPPDGPGVAAANTGEAVYTPSRS